MKKKMKVLLVDNSPIQAGGMENLLKHYSEYLSIEHVKKGWDMVTEKTITPDLVVLDHNVPGEDGIELMVGIKLKHPRAKVVLLTQDCEPYYRNLCEMLGADYYFDTSALTCLPEPLKLMILNYHIAA